MALKIDKKHFELIKAYGEESYPNECCGFLFGKIRNGDKDVVSTMPANNAQMQSEQYHRFLIRPDVFLDNEKFAKKRGLEIIGFYHSHPNAAARPSKYDLDHAWPMYSYVIVSVSENKANDVTSWTLADERSQFKEEDIIVLETAQETYS
ncbi:M67 family metallopeptidase [candidate division KSB1 bacterium]|nr:M67 family metallopeptidase [candidate division KSB1 bacterium]NIR70541.1 M67 family metallopeptidase [candidate division KSB1 bacterium]NIS26213.1 M67 family metallopeptidase [candidate division KSB1 bacterium]NIT72992.1 M67 family metallopeptidase [candidate division KSB1 bacterium]NIU26861.1 M67 family metallopeptidase [candidate division KSB1 bacterium]